MSRFGAVITVFWAITVLSGGQVLAGEAHSYGIPAKLSADEQRWFMVFQEGNFIAEGWQDISAEVLAKTPPEQRPAQKVALENLGTKIGTEWCRANEVRKVNSSMLQKWGEVLRKTARKNPHKLGNAIAFINQELDAALGRFD